MNELGLLPLLNHDINNNYLYLLSNNDIITDIDDTVEFQVTCNCMKSVGINELLQKQIFQLISFILQLGNIIFDEDAEIEKMMFDEQALMYKGMPLAARITITGNHLYNGPMIVPGKD